MLIFVADGIWSFFKKDDLQKWIIKTRFGLEYSKKEMPNFDSESKKFKELMADDEKGEAYREANTQFLIQMGLLDFDADKLSLLSYFNLNMHLENNVPVTIPFKV